MPTLDFERRLGRTFVFCFLSVLLTLTPMVSWRFVIRMLFAGVFLPRMEAAWDVGCVCAGAARQFQRLVRILKKKKKKQVRANSRSYWLRTTSRINRVTPLVECHMSTIGIAMLRHTLHDTCPFHVRLQSRPDLREFPQLLYIFIYFLTKFIST